MDKDNDVELIGKSTPYRGYFRIDKYRLRHRRYDGGWSQPLDREVFERGHSVAVLPYDPTQDAVVLIEQFRMAPYAVGDHPWLIEAIAGIVEAGEAPEDVARREAVEEADCRLDGPLTLIGKCYLSPGGTSEHCHLFCGRCDSTGLGGVHGLAEEGEDIRVLVLAFDAAMALIERGEIRTSPAMIGLLWLARHRDRLRQEWRRPAGR